MANSKLLREAVVILGAGTQGRRLAYMWSSTGKPVHLVDQQESQLSQGLDHVHQLRTSSSSISTNWGKITTSKPSSLKEELEKAWLAIECVPENFALKQSVISQLDNLAPDQTILASNSSSYVIGEIIENLSLNNPRRVLSAHCYWPPETPAIEIMGYEQTDPSIIDLLVKKSEEHGFTPYRVRKPSVGYIYNRIWAAIKRETLLTLSEGVASPNEIDAIFRDVLKTPKGPCELMDVVGLDVVLDIEKHYAETRKNLPSEPQKYLQDMIDAGNLGVKNSRGFYKYPRE
ncbi:uncharacterized protein TRUGW13939_09144 [Talaromyces rugulosus]|uniref:3-hydroxyacyl-CoA dehydrogenase NAD binding domain-containing protein n=1 Tax=Talaromyces rugulosus TaxID=121627 RepID=A0A7H8R7W9_TALRU|nr:uncharacterized protein TRUGW13939_09144 [Talaromyces rugulosus]QKX61988.1 hypothetical protein TRUGW13939_09144 [Talaromyces rugulosus]